MGPGSFLHGNLDPPNDAAPVFIRCPNEKCKKKITKALLSNGKKVCLFCKQTIPLKLLKKIEGKK